MGKQTKSRKSKLKKRNGSEIIDDGTTNRLKGLNYKIKCKFKNKKQKELSTSIEDNRITFVTGAPGTGKTFVALKTGLELLKDDRVEIGDILLTTPIIEVSSKSIGALPGDLDSKINNYFSHFYDNIDKIVGNKTLNFLKEDGLINDKIVNFIRGNTFGKMDDMGNPVGTYCILDEAQNLTKMELKTYISRLGENSKMVILGDIEQSDIRTRNGEQNALCDAIDRFSDIEGVGIIEFDEEDIVRDKFLIEIMKRYKD